MTDLNKVILIGRITRDQDEKSFGYIGNGLAKCRVSIACNRSKKVGDNWENEVSYFDVTIWGKTAENLKPYLTKGKTIAVEGYLRQERWEKDGQKHSAISIQAENVHLLGSEKKADPNGDDPATIQPKATFKEVPENVKALSAAFDGTIFQEDDEILF